jgi:hypothetical protein
MAATNTNTDPAASLFALNAATPARYGSDLRKVQFHRRSAADPGVMAANKIRREVQSSGARDKNKRRLGNSTVRIWIQRR